MLAVTLAAALLAQGPGGEGSGYGGSDQAEAIVIEGTVELSRAEAEQAALRNARDEHRTRIRERGEELAGAVAAFWLPRFVVQREVEHWTRSCERTGGMRVLDQATVERRFSYGNAYQTTVRVAADAAAATVAGEQALERRLRAAGKLFLAKCGAIAVFWGLLALLQHWLDRLSRGYMTWRLRLIALCTGVVVPPVLLLL